MKGLLVRVGADQSEGGGYWNGIVDDETGCFVYVPIPENAPIHPGSETPYSNVTPVLAKYDVSLPPHLTGRSMHLDPDFRYLTYGDQGERAKQLTSNLKPGDLLVFYAGLKNLTSTVHLNYAIIGFFVVEKIVSALDIPAAHRNINAHSRRILQNGATDIIVFGKPGVSGRLKNCISIGEYRDRAYRVRNELLEAWGRLSVKDGYLQRSARLPRFLEPLKFKKWFDEQQPTLLQQNN